MSWMTKDRDKMRSLCAKGEPQVIGKPGGTGAGKRLEIPVMPHVRQSIIPSGNSTPTARNSARAKDLRKARNRKIRAAKNSAE